jgi:hypothetical protein
MGTYFKAIDRFAAELTRKVIANKEQRQAGEGLWVLISRR